MNILKATGLAAVAGLLLFAAPGQRAEAASIQSPGIAAAVQQGAIAGTTEVRWHRGWRRHHGWQRHYGWRRHHGWHRRHWHRRHWR